MHVSETGWLLDGLEQSFFLNIGQTLAFFQSSGKQAWSNDAWKSNNYENWSNGKSYFFQKTCW